MNGDRIHPDQRVNPYGHSHWQAKLAACLIAVALLLAISIAYAGEELYRAVLCPPNWKIIVSQRYDTRDRFDWIVKRTWIAKCL